ncbi:MAG TPA: TetR/AcrR family transcriptional regulator [Acetobacteraceae bacterium]|nr:TetR/AcrR family transcriptional regulator [Acetobacteraceae bacterium]
MNKVGEPGWATLAGEAARRWAVPEQSGKQDRSRRRQQVILEAAVHVFARDGITRARIVDIATQAGVPLSSVYDYYPSKEDLAYALPATRMGQFYAEFMAKAPAEPTAEARLRLYLWLTADFARRNPAWARVLYLEIWPSIIVTEGDVGRSIDDFARILVALIRDGEQRGEWPEGPDRYQTASIFIGSISQILITWLLYARPRNLMAATSAMIERILPILDLASAPRHAAISSG